jgi:tetratricopeptide (TPR) repeat protein
LTLEGDGYDVDPSVNADGLVRAPVHLPGLAKVDGLRRLVRFLRQRVLSDHLSWRPTTPRGDDHDLIAVVRVHQSTTALWADEFQEALNYAQDGQRYATRARRAQLAARCEARAYTRLKERTNAFDALQRADLAMPSQSVTDDPGGGWSVFSPGALELYTGISLLWLGDAKEAEPHARQAITCYETQPFPLQSPANYAQAKITLATCLVDQDHPDEGIRLAAEALRVGQGHVEANLQQAREFLVALAPRHRDWVAARDFAERLRAISASRPGLSPG